MNSDEPEETFHGLVNGFSIEITARDVPGLIAAAPLIPENTEIHIAHLANEDDASRIEAASVVHTLGFRPVPHIAARRVSSKAQLARFLSDLRPGIATKRVLIVGGDPEIPVGPFLDSLSVITSGLLEESGISEVAIAGYPDGHPDIKGGELWSALTEKVAALANVGVKGSIVTQFGFDAHRVMSWVEHVRDEGIALPVHVGVPGPAGAKRLLAYARRFGIATSAGIVRKYGISLGNLLATTGPELFLGSLGDGVDDARHGRVGVHFYSFGDVEATARWISKAGNSGT